MLGLSVVNQYGLLAVMIRGRYEIEFQVQDSNDGHNWTACSLRYKPRALDEPPRFVRTVFGRYWFTSVNETHSTGT